MRCIPRTALMAALVILPGCLVVPIPEKAPYRSEVTAALEPDAARRVDVLMKLGAPRFVHEDESVLLYQADQVRAGWLFFIGNGYTAVGGAGTIATRHVFALEFDRAGVLRHAEVLRFGNHIVSGSDPGADYIPTRTECTSWGLCVHQGGHRISRE